MITAYCADIAKKELELGIETKHIIKSDLDRALPGSSPIKALPLPGELN